MLVLILMLDTAVVQFSRLLREQTDPISFLIRTRAINHRLVFITEAYKFDLPPRNRIETFKQPK